MSFWRSLPWVPDRRPIYEWASDNIELPPVLTKTGGFDVRDSRHFIAPLDALKSDLVREVNICAPPRSGKTLIADLWVPWLIVNDPAAILWVFDVDDSARLHCETRVHPILNGCAAVRPLLPTSQQRHQNRTQAIQFSNGLPLHVTGPAIANLQARGYRAVICDELWNWPLGRLTEAKARMGDFEKVQSNKFLGISQGGADGDDWHGQFKAGELNEWNIPCAHCGHLQPAAWTGKRADKSRWGVIYDTVERKDGTCDVDLAAASARYACRDCGHEHPDSAATRARWNLHGSYVPQGDLIRTRKSFTWTSVVDTPLSLLVVDWLRARAQAKQGFYLPMVQFFQKRLAQWSTQNRVIEQENPVEVIEFSPTTNWDGEVARFMTVDVQSDDLFYVLVCAWSKTECRRLHWEGVYGAGAVEAVRIQYDVPPARTLMDCGHVRKEASNIRRTYLIIAEHGYLGVAGRAARQFLHGEQRTGKQVAKPWSPQWWGDPQEGAVQRRPGNRLARCVHSAFEVVALRTLGLMENGFFKDPPAADGDEVEADYRAQLNAEKLLSRPNPKTNRLEKYWRVSGPNHALDCRRMQTLAAMMMGIL